MTTQIEARGCAAAVARTQARQGDGEASVLKHEQRHMGGDEGHGTWGSESAVLRRGGVRGSFGGWVRRRGGGAEGGSRSAAEEAEACKAVASIHPGTGVDWLQERSSVGGWLRELED